MFATRADLTPAQYRAMREEIDDARAQLDALAAKVARTIEAHGFSPAAVSLLSEAIKMYDTPDDEWSARRDHDAD